MTFKEIKELIKIFNESDISKISIKDEDFKIDLDKSVAVSPAPVQVQQTPVVVQEVATQSTPQVEVTQNSENKKIEGELITSPMVGTFYAAPSPDSAPFVKVGSRVQKGDTLCILEAMKIMNEFEAEFGCEILEVLVEDGQAVEFDTPLFRVKRI